MANRLEVGFIGTGIMGYQMVRRLCQAGHSLKAWNRTRAKAERLAEFGARIADTPAAAAARSDVVIAMLSDGPTCDRVLIGPGGGAAPVLAAMAPGSAVIVMSSIPVATARAQAEKAATLGLGYLDAPVSGGETGAREGTLAIMAGGEQGLFDRMAGVLSAMGRPTRIGPAGTGQLAKLANQVIVANTIATVAEALLLAQKGGADPAAVREALGGGYADSTILKQHGQRMCQGNWQPGGPAKYQVKDQRTALALADELGLDLPVTKIAYALFLDMVEHGDGDLDHSAVYLELMRRNGLPGDPRARPAPGTQQNH